MKVRDILKDNHYQQKKVLEKLLCYYMGISKEELVTSYEMEVAGDVLQRVKTGYDEYVIDKKPLEFILGFVEFFGRKFKVDSRTLIPRPETEYMIEAVNEHVQQMKEKREKRKDILIDVGTGCGVLGLSVLLENPRAFDEAFLTEYYDDTLTLARENVAHYSSDVQLADGTSEKLHVIKANLVDFLIKDYELGTMNCDFTLVANLPYIPDETFDTQTEDNVRKREPRPAFVGGDDGLDFYREMFQQIFEVAGYEGEKYHSEGIKLETEAKTAHSGEPGLHLDRSHDKLAITMFLEMMTRQVDILRKEFGDKIEFDEIKTFHFNIRIVRGRLR